MNNVVAVSGFYERGSEDLRMVDPISFRNQLVDSWNMEGRFDATTISQY